MHIRSLLKRERHRETEGESGETTAESENNLSQGGRERGVSPRKIACPLQMDRSIDVSRHLLMQIRARDSLIRRREHLSMNVYLGASVYDVHNFLRPSLSVWTSYMENLYRKISTMVPEIQRSLL